MIVLDVLIKPLKKRDGGGGGICVKKLITININNLEYF
jgi:hypothetical protein